MSGQRRWPAARCRRPGGWHQERHRPALLVVLVSAPFLHAITLGQWLPALTAAAVLPCLGLLFGGKPNIGLAILDSPVVHGSLGPVAGTALALVGHAWGEPYASQLEWVRAAGKWSLYCAYLPCLLFVLRRPASSGSTRTAAVPKANGAAPTS